MSGNLLQRIDHLVYAVPDLERGVDHVERLLGARATFGGAHPGHGTHMALVALGPASYLEIIAPDPQQPKPEPGRWLGLDDLARPRLATWAAKSDGIDRDAQRAMDHGIPLGAIRDGRRARPDGGELRWRLTDPQHLVGDGLVPFLIDWGESPHPAKAAASALRLIALRAKHPEPGPIGAALAALGVPISVAQGAEPALIATIDGPNGEQELR